MEAENPVIVLCYAPEYIQVDRQAIFT